MGILSISAIIVLLACNGVIGAKSEGVGQCKKLGQSGEDITYFRDVPEVINQALPIVKKQLGLSSIEVLYWENALRREVKRNQFRWEITIATNSTYGGTAQKKQVMFRADLQNAAKCQGNRLVCIKKVHVVKPANDGNGVNGTGGEVIAWQYVTNITDFRNLYEVIDQALPIIKEELKMSSIEVLNWESAQRKIVMGGFKWVISIYANDTEGGTAQEKKVIFEADQRIARECKNDKLVCIKNVYVVKSADEGCAKEYSGYQDLPSFNHFRVLYKAIKPMLQFRREEVSDPYIDIVGISEVKFQKLPNGTKWQIIAGVKARTFWERRDINSTMDLIQLPPEFCEVEGRVCFEDVDETNVQFLSIPFTLPPSKSFSRRFNCCWIKTDDYYDSWESLEAWYS